jgi:hypothetical protein
LTNASIHHAYHLIKINPCFKREEGVNMRKLEDSKKEGKGIVIIRDISL